jgi:hypothetical protein
MSYIHAIGENIIKYPYTRDDLIKDNPNVSFPINPTEKDLALFNVYILAPTVKPEVEDPRTQRVYQKTPILVDNVWKEDWGIRNATESEIIAYDESNAPLPDWFGFKAQVINSESMNAAFLSAMPVAPIAALMLAPSLNMATEGNTSDFITAWNTLFSKNLVSENILNEVISLATDHNLPISFIQSLQGNN